MPRADLREITQRLQFWNCGEKQALNELVPLVYSELRKIASGYLRRERPDHTLRTTALVHEAYIRLANQTHLECQGRTHFYAIAAHLMRQILVDHARERNAVKRGGGNKVALEEADAALSEGRAVDLIQLDHALDKLAELDPRQSRIVEMRFFAGLTEDEIAEVLGIAPVTVKRDWRAAKLLLFKLLSPR
uniref:RNA polymerase, sigma-24 subunit, ECF subfamily n=1 Tax=Solibacter usitatus (strain Ellin6076) TaxID=234267 RepID=Q01P93_SOLUE